MRKKTISNTYQGSNSWIIDSNRITLNIRELNAITHIKIKITNLRRLWVSGLLSIDVFTKCNGILILFFKIKIHTHQHKLERCFKIDYKKDVKMTWFSSLKKMIFSRWQLMTTIDFINLAFDSIIDDLKTKLECLSNDQMSLFVTNWVTKIAITQLNGNNKKWDRTLELTCRNWLKKNFFFFESKLPAY